MALFHPLAIDLAADSPIIAAFCITLIIHLFEMLSIVPTRPLSSLKQSRFYIGLSATAAPAMNDSRASCQDRTEIPKVALIFSLDI
jgi:hypothetical protein